MLSLQIFKRQTYIQVGVGFVPRFFVLPVVAVFQFVDDRKERGVDELAITHLFGIDVLLPAHTISVVAAGTNIDFERLHSCAGTGLQNIEETSARPRM